MIRRAAVALALLALVACKPTCEDLKTALDAAKASGNAILIEAAQTAYNEAKCNVVPPPPPPATCADGLPPGPTGCPKTCDDLACLYGCDQPDPHKDATCKPKPIEPPPPVEPPPTLPCVVEANLEVTVPQLAAQLAGVVTSEIALMGDTSGQPPALTLERLASRLRAKGLCAIAGQEAVFVRRLDGKFEEYHAVFFGSGALIPGGKFMGTHYDKTAEPPPVSDACPAEPCPARVWTADTLPAGWGEDAIGKPRWSFKAKPHTMGNADSTPVLDRDEPYCRAIGLSPYADGTLRGTCPVRPDGHPEREAVERWLLEGGPVRDSRGGQDCTPNNTDNPYAFLAGTGNCRVCNTPRTVCSAWL